MKNRTLRALFKSPILRTILAFSLLAGMLIPASAAAANGPAIQSQAPAQAGLETAYHTITIDGTMTDWAADELMETDNGGGMSITWDASNLYVGLSNVDIDTNGVFFFYMDTEAGGTTAGQDWNGIHTLPFAADYGLAIDSDGNVGWLVEIGGVWTWNAMPVGYNDYVGWSGNPNSEFQIPFSAMGNPSYMYVMGLFQNQANNGVTASWPTPNPASNVGNETFTHHYHFPSLIAGIVPNLSVLATHVVINEFRPKGTEYIELYNPTDQTIDLTGWYLDDVACGAGTTFIGAVNLAPGAYFVVNATEAGDNFDLANDGDFAYLCNATHGEIDAVAFGYSGGAPLSHTVSGAGNSTARTPNGTDTDDYAADWNIDTTPTPALVNDAPAVLLGSTVLFNEIDVFPAIGNDMVEIYNPTAQAVNLNGWLLSDGDGVATIVTSPTVNPGSWVVLEETVDWALSMDFNNVDVAYLFLPNGVRVDQIGWYNEYEDNTFQRIGDGQGPNDGYNWTSSGGGVTWFDVPSTLGYSNNTADLAITKTGNALVSPGENMTYTISYNNPGPSAAQNVTVGDTLPGGVTYVSDDSGLVCTGCTPGGAGPLSWTVGAMSAGASDTFNLVVLVDPGLSNGTMLVNTATIASTTADSNLANNQSQVTTAVSTIDLSVQKTGPHYVVAGSQLVYTIVVNNAGVEDALNVILTDTLPISTTFVSENSGVTLTNPIPGEYVWSFGNLISDTILTFQMTVTVDVAAPDGTALTNQAVVSTSTPADPTDNNVVQHTAVVITPIHDIQGAAHLSPLTGQVMQTAGIVTVVRSNAFYMQDPYADANDATSEAIYVYVGSATGRTVGDEVLVTGTVAEYRIGGTATNLTLTQLGSPTVVLLSSANPLPATTILGNGGRIPPAQVIEDDATGDVETSGTFDPATDGIDFYESLEGMRVQINNAVAVAATNGFGEIAVVGDAGANASVLSPRGGIVIQSGDMNPERILVDDTIISGEPQINTGATFNAPIIGVMDFTFGNFKLFNTEALNVTNSTLLKEITTLTGSGTQVTVASFNLENLDPSDGARFGALADEIVDNLLSPDIIAVQEIQDNNGATNDGTVDASLTYQTLINAIVAAGGPVYDYRDIAPVNNEDGGEPGGNIRVGFLFRTDRGITFVDRPGGDATTPTGVSLGANGVELTYSPGRIDPNNAAFLDSRKPLAGEFLYNGHKIIIIANHLNSKGGDQPLFGRYQPPTLNSEVQRMQQATVLHAFVEDILALDPNANVIVIGDLNDFQFSNPLQTLVGAGELNILNMTLPANERYSYNYDGNAQALDHTLVSDALLPVTEFDVVHVNSEYLDASRPSDHDPSVARFTLAPTTVAIEKTVETDGSVDLGDVVTYTIVLTNETDIFAVDLMLTDTLPVELTFGGWVLQNGAALVGDTITWNGDLAGNEVLSFVFTATLNVDFGLYGQTIINTAEFELPYVMAGTADATFTVIDPPVLGITKDVALVNDPALPGDVIWYTIVVANTGPADAIGVHITDTLPVELFGGTDLDVTVDIASNSVYTWDVIATVEDLTYGAVVTNTAYYEYALGNGSAEVVFNVTDPPVLDITKDVELLNDPALPGDVVTYTIVVANTGPADAIGVHITDTLPAELIGTDVDVTVDIPGNDTYVLVFTAVVDAGTYGAVVTNTAYYEYALGNGSAEVVFNVTDPPVLDITKDVELLNDPALPGDVVTYTIVVANTGPAEAIGVRITDTLPAELIGTDVDVTVDIPGNSEYELIFTAIVDAGTYGAVVTNTAYYEYALGNGSAEVVFNVTDPPVLDITKDVELLNDPALPGDVVTYTIVVANTGPADAIGVHITDTLPAELIGTDVDVTVDIPGNSVYTHTFTAVVDAGTYGAIVVNTAYFEYDLGEGSAEVAFNVSEGTAELSIAKTVELTNDPALPGDVVTYTIVVTNAGPVDAVDVHVVDVLPAGLLGEGVDITVTIAAQDAYTVIFTATVAGDVLPGATITNTASFEHSTGNGTASASFTIEAVTVFYYYLPIINK